MIDISLYVHCSVFFFFFFFFFGGGGGVTSDFSIHLMHFTSELQTPIPFLFVSENIKFVPIGIPAICLYNFEPNLINILSK